MLWNSRDFLTKMEVKDKSIAKMRQLNLEILYDLLFFEQFLLVLHCRYDQP